MISGLKGLGDVTQGLIAQKVDELAPGLGSFLITPSPGGGSRRRSGRVKDKVDDHLNSRELGRLRAGFMDAGRKDLAKMVKTRDFQEWLNKESAGRTRIVGAGLGDDRRVGGVFQFMDFQEGRPWLQDYFDFDKPGVNGLGKFTMPLRMQARMAAQNFGLSPEAIRKYADQIAAGTYKGWG